MKMSVEEIKKTVEAKKSARMNWETLWQDIGDYIFTRKSNILIKRTGGEDLQVDLYDNTGPQSLELLAGIMMAILMSVAEPWLEVSSGEAELDKKDHIKAYLQKTSATLHSMLANSNFYTEAHESILDICGFGTSIFGIEEDTEEDVRFFAKFIAEGYIGEDARGKVDELFMEYEYTAGQIAKEYGDKNLPKDVLKALEKNSEDKFKVIHAIYPVDRVGKKADAKGHNYHSQHVMPDQKHELKMGGFASFPYPTPRFSKATGEIYGRSPAMIALPEVKVLNKMVEITLIGAEKVIDPPLQAPDDGFITQINTFPGSISYYRAGGNDIIRPIFADARIDFGFQMIQEKQSKIRDAFFINQLQVQPKEGNPATAFEVSQMVAQATRFMGSFLARMQKEFLQPTMSRVIEIAFKRNILLAADVPKELQGKKFVVRYTSFIAKSQRLGTLENIMRFYQAVTPLVNADPTIRHIINGVEGVKVIADILGTPAQMLHTDKEVEAARKAEMQAQQQAQQQEQQQAQAQVTQQQAQMGKMVTGG